jgi:rhodanese-related sulfurtransferase
MSRKITVGSLQRTLDTDGMFSLVDVREPSEYFRGHIPKATLIPRGELELRIERVIPHKNLLVVLYCDDGRRSSLAARSLDQMGYTQGCFLEGGIACWKAMSLPLEVGIKLVGKTYGERLAVEHHLPELEVEELARRRGAELFYVVDTRTPEEFAKGHIPGAFNIPGGQLPLLIEEVAVVKNAPIVTCCAGRTRSLIAAYALREMGFSRVYALTNGVLAWAAAGFPLEVGPVSGEVEVSVHSQCVPTISAEHLYSCLQGQDPPLLLDIRSLGQFASGHPPGAQWVARGLLEVRLPAIVAGREAALVIYAESMGKGSLAYGTIREMGYTGAGLLSGGVAAWKAAGFPLEIGFQGVPAGDISEADINQMIAMAGPATLPCDMLNRVMREKIELFERVRSQS